MIKKKYIALATAFLILATGMTSCSENEADNAVTDEKNEITETKIETCEIEFVSASSKYSVIRPDNADSLELAAAQTFVNAVSDSTGKRPTFDTDYVKPTEDPNKNATEILIGRTNRDASEKAYAMLEEEQFVLAAIDNRLVCVGYTPALTKLAAEVLSDKITSEGLVLSEDFCEIYNAEADYTYTEFTNPVASSGADPWVIRDGDKYYYCYSGGDGVCVNELESLTEITTEGGRKVYTAPSGTEYSSEYWAPELHKIDGKWYIYVAADDGDNYNHRMYVLECTSDTDPTADYKMLGKITDSTDKWAIDGTVLEYGGEYYFVWSGWEGDENLMQNIYIAHMSSPSTIDSERVMISRPNKKWEIGGGSPLINEGPVALTHGDALYIVYSGSGSWSDYYCLSMLTFNGGDILDAANWQKSDGAVFAKTDKVFGPGHCSFTTSPDGETWMIYHANLTSGTGWSGRSVWICPITWDGDTPVFPTPPDKDTVLEYPTKSYSKDKITLVG